MQNRRSTPHPAWRTPDYCRKASMRQCNQHSGRSPINFAGRRRILKRQTTEATFFPLHFERRLRAPDRFSRCQLGSGRVELCCQGHSLAWQGRTRSESRLAGRMGLDRGQESLSSKRQKLPKMVRVLGSLKQGKGLDAFCLHLNFPSQHVHTPIDGVSYVHLGFCGSKGCKLSSWGRDVAAIKSSLSSYSLCSNLDVNGAFYGPGEPWEREPCTMPANQGV